MIKANRSLGSAGTHDNRTRHAGAGGGGRSSAISRRISTNRILEMATSAIWKAIWRPWLTSFAPILISFSLGAGHCSRAAGLWRSFQKPVKYQLDRWWAVLGLNQ
ncbi:MAG: hypothetical protein GY798_29265 [Hyphomicrobiales bacterium]|nr:hypothetical protein [Hyphomicrobiales bacterium]